MSPSGAAPAQPSLRRLRRFGVRPDRELGQNFLIDSNILGVIGREAALAPSDVVLEVGGGLGVLSEYLAERVAHVHVVEVDERLREALGDAVGGRENVSLWWADAMRLDLGALQPAPVKVVANLPYGIAAGFVLRALQELPSVGAGGGDGPARGGRAAGRPAGNRRLRAALRAGPARLRGARRACDSPHRLLPGAERRLGAVGADPPPARAATEPGELPDPRALRALVAASFAHRRKTLAGSLRLAEGGEGSPGWERERVREALGSLGLPGDVRAERLSPEQFLQLARKLER